METHRPHDELKFRGAPTMPGYMGGATIPPMTLAGSGRRSASTCRRTLIAALVTARTVSALPLGPPTLEIDATDEPIAVAMGDGHIDDDGGPGRRS